MPRFPIVAKTIKGRTVSQSEFKSAIAKAVSDLGRARPRQVIAALGPEWRAPDAAKLVAKTMANMVNAHILSKDPDTAEYYVTEADAARAKGSMEEVILDIVRRLGGMARTRDILEAMDARPSQAHTEAKGMHAKDGSDNRRVRRALATTRRLKRYYKEGVWGLPWGELQNYPLTGYWLEFLYIQGMLEGGPVSLKTREGQPRLLDNATKLFSNVGLAFKEVRLDHEVEIHELMRVKEIKEAMNLLRNRSPRAVEEAYFDIRTTADREGNNDPRRVEAIRSREVPHVLSYIYAAFELGSAEAHRAAPVELYRAFATHFHLCPASLSRGLVMPCPPSILQNDVYWEPETEEEIEFPDVQAAAAMTRRKLEQ